MKKLLGLLLLFITSAIVFTSCQKELSAEGGLAKGSLIKDASGDCVPALPNGIFKVDTVLVGSNYVDVKVKITQVGVYTISTDTVNGYSFRAVGVTAVLGDNTIRLLGKGKPIAVGTDVFKVKFDTSICEFNINVLNATGGGGGGGTVAAFTLGNTAGGCTSTIAGTYAQNMPTGPGNTVTIAITVQTPGTFTLSTALINGVRYSAAGTLALTTTSIILVADGGTPAAAGLFAHALSAGTSTCSFDITYTAPLAPGVYTFNCGSADVQGTYQSGVAMDASNKIVIPVTVTTAGAYNITVTAANGISFFGSGMVSVASPTVTLFATGTPGTGLIANYVVSGGGGPNCSVPIPFDPPAATGFIRARVGSATASITTFNVNTAVLNPNANTIGFAGDNNATGTEYISIAVISPAIVINTNYTVNQIATGVFMQVDYATPAGIDYSSATDIVPQPISPFTVRFTTITANRIVGTFSGRMKDDGTGALNLDFFGGEFDLTF